MNFKNKIRYREKIIDRIRTNTIRFIVSEENSIVMSAEPTLACKYIITCMSQMSIPKFKHKIQT